MACTAVAPVPTTATRSPAQPAVAAGDVVVRGALEDIGVCCLLGDLRDGLHRRRPGPDDGDPLPREVDTLVRPDAGVVPLAAEALPAGEGGGVGRRQAADRGRSGGGRGG